MAGTSAAAVVVGINDYLTLKHLQGAVADAKDISAALKGAGVTDLVTLLDADATRERVLNAIDQATARARKDDLVIITFAGHGGREKWGAVHPPKTKTGEQHEIFLLRNVVLPNADNKLNTQLGGSLGERILGGEMAVRLKKLDDLGITPQPSGWKSSAMADTETVAVDFNDVRVAESRVIGGPNWYLSRPGFWHGAIGPAACWAGGAVSLIEAASPRRSSGGQAAHGIGRSELRPGFRRRWACELRPFGVSALPIATVAVHNGIDVLLL